MNLKSKILAITALGIFLALTASADQVDVYQIGSTSGICGANTALDPTGACISGTPTPTWVNNFTGATGDPGFLSILAEGIDNGSVIPGGEVDGVTVNGTFVGNLTQQSFYSIFFNLSNSNAGTGPLDLDGDAGDPVITDPGTPAGTIVTDLSLSTFFVPAGILLNGANTIVVNVDPTNWVNEIDTSGLTAVPEPSSLLLLATGVLCGISSIRKRLI